ncbi:MAG TPA: hypothetical protein VF651_00880 [Gammaproteobacteria bacterium]
MSPLAQEAVIPNPALEPFRVLVGEWTTEGTHPHVPGKVFHGRASFQWIEGGAFLMMRSETDEPEVPSGLAIFGSDNVAGECWMLYFDERGVSRNIQTAMRDGVWTWWRYNPKFSQRFTGTFTDGGRTLVSKGEMSKDGGPWEPDLQLTYKRVEEE